MGVREILIAWAIDQRENIRLTAAIADLKKALRIVDARYKLHLFPLFEEYVQAYKIIDALRRRRMNLDAIIPYVGVCLNKVREMHQEARKNPGFYESAGFLQEILKELFGLVLPEINRWKSGHPKSELPTSLEEWIAR